MLNQRGSIVEAIIFFVVSSVLSVAGLLFASHLFQFDGTRAMFGMVAGLLLVTVVYVILYLRRIGKTAKAWQKKTSSQDPGANLTDHR